LSQLLTMAIANKVSTTAMSANSAKGLHGRGAKSETLKEKHGWLGALLAAFALAWLSLKRIWREPRN
jgi:hypothetical protein